MANLEHLALVERGVDAINRFAREHEDVGLNLEDADLSGRDLRNVRLQNANLDGASLARCDLRNARLNSSSLRRCDLRDADLRGVNMHRADLTGADLRGATFDTIGEGGQRVCISPMTFQNVHWQREDLERILEQINLNPDWEVRYEIVPRGEGAPPAS